MILFQPAQFLPVRTIRKHRLHVASHRFLYQPVGIIEDAVGAFEGGYFRSRVINKARLYLLDHRKTEGILLPFQHSTFHLNIPEAIVGETRMPSFHSLPFQSIFIIMLSAGLTLIASSLVRQDSDTSKVIFCPFFPRTVISGTRPGSVPYPAQRQTGPPSVWLTCRRLLSVQR